MEEGRIRILSQLGSIGHALNDIEEKYDLGSEKKGLAENFKSKLKRIL